MFENSVPLTLTWQEDGETVGVSAPLDVWVAQIVLNLPEYTRVQTMDGVVSEIERLNELVAAELEAAEAEESEEEEDENIA